MRAEGRDHGNVRTPDHDVKTQTPDDVKTQASDDGYATVDDPDGYFGEAVAAHYDETSAEMFAPETVDPAVALIAELAEQPGRSGRPEHKPRALEFGVGTGRIALPLARAGVPVHGIDMSRAMVERMRAKPGGDAIGVTIGDFATARADGEFTVAYLVFNTINNLLTQDAQVDCFRNAAAHLVPGGCFVIEVGVPALRSLPPGQDAVPFHVGPDRLGFDTYDVATQGMRSHHVRVVDGRATHLSIPFRYVWPAELDLMARLAGMRLRDRWEDWDRRPFTSDSTRHVSVWEKG
ncbi:class I SAM-dependent DNA methyltransferase [Streptomyces sp. MA5143a]|uniref:class I SAM-dependent DNA methyltransferase n=1 Tax=Streptomyces sp. MA5143a TaxID=2083010 RepID=UPI000D1A269B|nr:class I SAM-dependent methyltransferase [Streptomyces sp. MA5143a]